MPESFCRNCREEGKPFVIHGDDGEKLLIAEREHYKEHRLKKGMFGTPHTCRDFELDGVKMWGLQVLRSWAQGGYEIRTVKGEVISEWVKVKWD
jgi:hypothetical protein